MKLTKRALGWPTEEPFYVPEEVLAHFRECIERGRGWYEEWEQRLGRVERLRDAAEGWDADVPTFDPSDVPMIATRKAGARGAPVGGQGRARTSWADRRTSRPRRFR